MILISILRGVVDNILINISQSNSFPTMLVHAIHHQKCEVAFGRCEREWVKDELHIAECFTSDVGCDEETR